MTYTLVKVIKCLIQGYILEVKPVTHKKANSNVCINGKQKQSHLDSKEIRQKRKIEKEDKENWRECLNVKKQK